MHQDERTTLLDERTSRLNDRPENQRARYVLYWMQMFKRTSYNHALNVAIREANARKLPLVVYEGLRFDYPWASDRLHTFILEGVEEKREAFRQQGIRYVFYLQRNAHDPRDTVERLSREAALVVTDDFPCFIIPRHNALIAKRASVPVYAVDSNGIVPLSALTKEEYAAYTIRPRIHRLLPRCLEPLSTELLHHPAPDLEVRCPEETREVTSATVPQLVAACNIDHRIAPSLLYHGGTAAGRTRLRHFLGHLLPRYHEIRNDPSIDGSSRLSSYLHFGFLSAHEIVEGVMQADAPDEARQAYLEELIVRRELSFNFTRFNPHHNSLSSLPDWAKETLRLHAHDPRPHVMPRERLETAQTYDALWDAAQRELLYTGEIHNYVRMLWGKLVLQWCATHEEAFAVLEDLNNRYALDGRDPNSYAGILWCFGKHDRAWQERPIFGKLRYMTSASMGRKFDSRRYIEWTKRLETSATQKI